MAGNSEGRRLWDTVLDQGVQFSTATIALGADHTFTEASLKNAPKVWFMDPGGAARKVLMPLAAETLKGHFIIIVNTADADEELNVKDSTDATLFTDIEQGGAAMFICDGVTWRRILGAAGGAT